MLDKNIDQVEHNLPRFNKTSRNEQAKGIGRFVKDFKASMQNEAKK